MSAQPEALMLADTLERMSLSTPWDKKAAAELRRLHELNAELLKALKLMCDRFLDTEGSHGQWEQEATDAAHAAIAKAEKRGQ